MTNVSYNAILIFLMVISTNAPSHSMEHSSFLATPKQHPRAQEGEVVPGAAKTSSSSSEGTNENTQREEGTHNPYTTPVNPTVKEHNSWFHAFTLSMDYAQSKEELVEVLRQGENRDLLQRPILRDSGYTTPIHYAAESGDLEMVKLLAEEFHVDCATTLGNAQEAPLHLAALQGRTRVVAYLLSKIKANEASLPDLDMHTLLAYAARGRNGMNNVDVIEYLVKTYHLDLEKVYEHTDLLDIARNAENAYTIGYLSHTYAA